MIAKKEFKQWMMGYLLKDIPVSKITKEMGKDAQNKAEDILKFAENHDLLNPELL